MTDPELKAMQELLEALEGFDQATVARILSWAGDRYQIGLVAIPRVARRARQLADDERPKIDIEALLRSA